MASIKDVAKRAGVSISTVSHALNGTKSVGGDLVKRVKIAAQELNYEVDPVARNMRKKNTRTIGVITADMCGLFYPYVLRGIYEIAFKHGYNVSIFDTGAIRDTGTSSYIKEKEGIKMFAANRVDGIIFSSMVQEDMEEAFANEVIDITQSKKKVALVSIERDFSQFGISSIFSDSFEGAAKATAYLLRIGCKKIGHITGPINFKIAQDRIKGYKATLESAGHAVDAATMVAHGDYTHQSGYLGMKKLLRAMPDMDGVFVANDQMAIGVCMALKEYRKRIPEDVKVIGYDDVFVSSVVEPSLSTIYAKKRSLGVEAARALIAQIQNEDCSEVLQLKLETRLVIRKSTEAMAPSDWILSEW